MREKLEQLPASTGVYLYRDRAGSLLYVGKAKSLRNRVRSYFQPAARHSPRKAALVAEVSDLEIIVVDSELEALVLESNLIKRHRPPYNVVLRDDKSYPYLRLSVEDEYPRLSLVRKINRGNSRYFGPFLPTSVARRTLKLVPRFFRVAACKERFDGKRRPCLYYHLDQCLAPCAGKTDREEYGKAVRDAVLFLDGKHGELKRSLTEKMRQSSETTDFEAAARYRDTIKTLERLGERQQMSSVGMKEQDYMAHHAAGAEIALQIFRIREGKVTERREFFFEQIDLDIPEFYSSVLAQYYSDNTPPPEIHLPEHPEGADVVREWLRGQRGGRVQVKVPRKGARRRLLELVRKNAEISFETRFRSPHTHVVAALEALAGVLGLDEPPYRIECFDISDIQGQDSVASLVVWEGGKAKKSEYRTFAIRDVSGPDDFASMAEAVTRRYRRLIREDGRLPDLVLIDGGPGQLGAAVRSLAAVGLPTVPVIALAKKNEEIHLQGGEKPIILERNSISLHLIQRIRDDAHRFAVNHHRRKRSKRTIKTELTEITGVGPVTARKLLQECGSVAGVREASRRTLERIVGKKVAQAIIIRYGKDEDERTGS